MPQTNRALAGAATTAVGRPPTLEGPHTADKELLAEIRGTLLTLSEESVGRRAVLSVAGEVDISNSMDLRAAIESAATRALEVWLDLTTLTFIDSSGLQALADARARLIEANTQLTLICPEGPVLRILALTGLDRMFEIHADDSHVRVARSHAQA